MGFKLVEKKANGAAVISALETEFSGFVGIEPEGSKEARMYAASPDYASHCVFVPDPAMPGDQWSLEHILLGEAGETFGWRCSVTPPAESPKLA